MQCHCDSKQPFPDCCQPFLEGRLEAPDPLTLMRSRYSAYCTGAGEYLVHTWHPDTLEKLDAATLRESGLSTEWLGLNIVFSRGTPADTEGEVEFKVRYREHDRVVLLHERSRFVRFEGRWVYHSGLHNPPKTGPNQPCPCHSGKKYKHCCNRR
ncbi:YchJ family protein [Oceanimonas baumannii]|uniref:SEC-C motif-containing protein n=2 Tax=Oceanimonas baumannii TaxID=129578 RepID=A0A235CL67_9GAMM|nr:YchJ family metal-binding protein [Oceanimonas baumannii]OYD25331.1 SecC motif-containing protein [Oceanimonas baumannii]TDW62371.1 SEC-C motif-containing protein [Oceanimonas baumannii]